MHILGVSDSHDAGAAIIKDGKIIVAVSEERLCRKKFAYGFPFKSIKEVLRLANLKKRYLLHNKGRPALSLLIFFLQYQQEREW